MSCQNVPIQRPKKRNTNGVNVTVFLAPKRTRDEKIEILCFVDSASRYIPVKKEKKPLMHNLS